ncbi:hypothetical protein DsansV1_C24g0183541 [Dioscorea sansibarensis]
MVQPNKLQISTDPQSPSKLLLSETNLRCLPCIKKSKAKDSNSSSCKEDIWDPETNEGGFFGLRATIHVRLLCP